MPSSGHRRARDPAGARQDTYQQITDRIIAELEAGRCPWREPWQAAGPPRSISTGHRYSGVNVLLLAMSGRHASPFWGTYRAIAQHGGQVRAGERATKIAFFTELRKEQPDPDTGEIETTRIPLLRLYPVFSAEQADGLPARFYPQPGDFQPDATADQVITGFLRTGGAPALSHDVHAEAYYRPSDHTIHLPPFGEHVSAARYYSTAFHELTHATGPALRRKEAGKPAGGFGSHGYGREELCAEMGAAFLCAETGIECHPTVEASAAYLRSWLDTIRGDKRMVAAAAAAAQRSTDMIMAPSRQAQPEIDRDSEPERTEAGRSYQEDLAIMRAAMARVAGHEPQDPACSWSHRTLGDSASRNRDAIRQDMERDREAGA